MFEIPSKGNCLPEPLHNGPVFLDYNATTPLDERVAAAMNRWMPNVAANSSSHTHEHGIAAKRAVEAGRRQVADVLGVSPLNVVFTSGATESNNLAILGLASHGAKIGKRHILSTSIEHPAVLNPLRHLAKCGFDVEFVPVDQSCRVAPNELAGRTRADTLLVSVMHANNEAGILQPIMEIAEIAHHAGAFFHTDASQTFGREIDELRSVPFDLLSLSAHKVYGPQGIGALIFGRKRTEQIPIQSILFGGGQERGLRPGTVPVALVVGLGVAAELAVRENDETRLECQSLRELILDRLKSIPHELIGDQTYCQSHVVNIRFPGVDSDALMLAVKKDLAFSNGAACSAESHEPSHVLLAMGLSPDYASECVRLSWGKSVSPSAASKIDTLVHVASQLAITL